MGEIADAMIDGEMCCYCGVYLEPKEIVFGQHDDKPYSMPINGETLGFPCYCSFCKED